MKKNYTLTLLLLLSVTIGFAQIPAGYYNSAIGTGYTLKTQLYNIIKNPSVVSYSPGLWNLYYTSDVRPDGKVWDIYSNCNFIFGSVASGGNQDDGNLGTSECQRYNREHTFPKSWFANATPMYSDAFHVMPTDKKVNGLRGNLAYGKVGTATYTASNGSKIGNCVAPNYPYSLQVFEPADQYKGDIARNYFYMATCYQNLIGGWETNDADANTVLDGTSDKVFEQWYLDLLYSWHIADPVSQKEIDRNNAVYGAQGNRNPYIDHPEWVSVIWGSTLATESFDALANATIFPNPTNDSRINIVSEAELNEIQLINSNGQIIQYIKKPASIQNTYRLDNLPKGFYLVKLSSENNKTITKKIVVN
ncbi:extracellular ribonuclease [Flavobacterium enshiense DK69]|uniref:Ribonuclease n=1 Tax=Flavobacterium enshiense DK69 TaxID=1107311 RepID=V6S1J6_9FLAO|nr:endonuclease [Flavobacterium enshiense]ESU20259.1 extracellular ribonuclease [Flavobacterium enshiense DK69]KGO95927.1 ribonuclease [Flavobacterium enshiense DK69]